MSLALCKRCCLAVAKLQSNVSNRWRTATTGSIPAGLLSSACRLTSSNRWSISLASLSVQSLATTTPAAADMQPTAAMSVNQAGRLALAFPTWDVAPYDLSPAREKSVHENPQACHGLSKVDFST